MPDGPNLDDGVDRSVRQLNHCDQQDTFTSPFVSVCFTLYYFLVYALLLASQGHTGNQAATGSLGSLEIKTSRSVLLSRRLNLLSLSTDQRWRSG